MAPQINLGGTITLDITCHQLDYLSRQNAAILAELQTLTGVVQTMSGNMNQLDTQLQTLQQQVQADTDATNSAVTTPSRRP